MIRSRNSIALSAAIVLAVVFFIGGNLLYEWLLATVVNARPDTVSIISTDPNGVFVHRIATLASFSFLGFMIGAALVVCAWGARTAIGLTGRYAGLALVAGCTIALCFAVLRARTGAFHATVSRLGFNVALGLEDIPLYLLGVLPGLCVFAYTVMLRRGSSRRND